MTLNRLKPKAKPTTQLKAAMIDGGIGRPTMKMKQENLFSFFTRSPTKPGSGIKARSHSATKLDTESDPNPNGNLNLKAKTSSDEDRRLNVQYEKHENAAAIEVLVNNKVDNIDSDEDQVRSVSLTSAKMKRAVSLTQDDENEVKSQGQAKKGGPDLVDADDWRQVDIGDKIAVFWPDDDQFYPATVAKRRTPSGSHFFIKYDDLETEWIDLTQHLFSFQGKTKSTRKRKDVTGNGVGTSRNRMRCAADEQGNKKTAFHDGDAAMPRSKSTKKRLRIENDDDDDEFEFDQDDDDSDGSAFDPKGEVNDDDDELEADNWMSCDDDDDKNGIDNVVSADGKANVSRNNPRGGKGKGKATSKAIVRHYNPLSAVKNLNASATSLSQFASRVPDSESLSSTGSTSRTSALNHIKSAISVPPVAQETLKYVEGAVNLRGSHVHNHLNFLRNPKDAKGRPPTHPDYDPRTLEVVMSDWTKHVKTMTNAVQQWWDLKSQYFDTVLLFKTGKFYEMFHMDADIGVQVLGLSYMKGHIAHAGFPEIRYGANADKLVRAGYAVARVEQTETPDMLAKRKKEHPKRSSTPKPQVVNREVCSIMTLGTRTFCYLDDESGLAQDLPGATGPLLSIREVMIDANNTQSTLMNGDDGGEAGDDARPVCEYGITLVDAVRSTVTIGQFADDVLRSRLNTLLAAYLPSEILLEDGDIGASPVLRSLIRSIQRTSQAPLRTEMIRCTESFPKSNALDTKAKAYLERPLEVHPWNVDETIHELHRRGYFPKASRQPQSSSNVPVSVSRWPAVLRSAVEGNANLALSSFGAALFYLQRNLIDAEILSMGIVQAYIPPSSQQNSKDECTLSLLSAGLNDLQSIESAEDLVEHLSLDGTTLRNLEILNNSVDNKVSGSLLSKINFTKTPHGARLFRKWLLQPLFRKADIERRQAAVAELVSGPGAVALSEAGDVLRKIGDLERLLSRVHSMSGKTGDADSFHPSVRAIMYEGPTYTRRKVADFSKILSGLRQAAIIPELFADVNIQSDVLKRTVKMEKDGGYFPDLNKILDWYYENCDIEMAMKGQFNPGRGTDEQYDNACDTEDRIRATLEVYKEEMCAKLNPKSIAKSPWKYANTQPDSKDKFLIELPASIRVPEDFILKGKRGSGQKQVNKYRTAYVQELVLEIEKAIETQKVQKQKGMQVIFTKFDSERKLWEAASRATALLDALGSLAKAASKFGYTRPVILDCPPGAEPSLKIIQGRHPCIDSESFIANDLVMGESDEERARVLLLSGPNMGGKSTLLRQTCLIAILAQIGSFVPAEECALTPMDCIYTRLGASDRILLGQSTFFVELAETATALRGATRRSLVIMDELGRGTSTFDGTAIAGATVQHLVERSRCLALFATHYHSLLEDFKSFPNVRLGHMECLVEEENGSDGEGEGKDRESRVTFLYTLGKGTCPRSFGINVARLAGLPDQVLLSAKRHSSEFEAEMMGRAANGHERNEAKLKHRVLSLIKESRFEELKQLYDSLRKEV